MFHGHGLPKSCYVLAVLCGEFVDGKEDEVKGFASYPFQKLVSSGRLEIHTLVNPSVDKFREVQKLRNPNILYLQGEKLASEEIGSLVWAGVDISDPERLCSLIGPSLPAAIYLEFQNGEKVAEALYSKGIPYVMYWKNGFSSYSVSHFRHAFFSVVQSSCSHTWDAFQIARASFRLYCVRNASDSPVKSWEVGGEVTPCILGEAPKFTIPSEGRNFDEEENSSYILPAISVYDVAVDMVFLICGVPYKQDARLGSLEDGLNTLLRIEIRGSKLHNRVSATPPPSLQQAGGLSSGVVTMRCDITTCSSAHISLLVSGSPRILFDDQLLETHIKNELTEKSQLVQALPTSRENKLCLVSPRKSSSIACGASAFEVFMKIPIWAAQVLKQLAPDVSYRSLVALGIASIQGTSVSSFEKEDAERILFFCAEQENIDTTGCTLSPNWFRLPAPNRHNQVADQKMKPGSPHIAEIETQNGIKGRKIPLVPVRQRLKVAAMRPIPHTRHHKMMPFSGTLEINNNANSHLKPTLPAVPSRKHMPTPVSRRKSVSNSHAQQMISLNPLPLEKHGCDRRPIRVCSEEEFLSDVMEFLILRGHSRLIPQCGILEFPDVILNAKRLDLYNLYREVVSRGGFHVGNGINWKGQVFSKMRNHTLTNRMTGVGNSLKRHYETYLLEYELAHDDVDGEFCLLCHSSAPGDWVNCGLCGEWAHFGCDRRQGLGAFKDYAKTGGLEYICPQCSVTTGRRKSLKFGNET